MAEPPEDWRALTQTPEDALGVALLMAIFVVMVVSVIFRYGLNDSLIWSEEVARYGLVLMTFIGAATGFRRHSHIAVDLGASIPLALRRLLAACVFIASLAVTGFLAWQAFAITAVLRTSRSAALEIPLAWLYGAVGVALVWATLRLVMTLWRTDIPR